MPARFGRGTEAHVTVAGAVGTAGVLLALLLLSAAWAGRRPGWQIVFGPPAESANRIALIGTHGTSLYIDFDKRLVIATFASHPQAYAPATLAVLEQAWKSIERGVVPVKKAK